jgi:hypothetical protein
VWQRQTLGTLNLANDLGLPGAYFWTPILGDPAQVLSIQKRKKVEDAGSYFSPRANVK